MCSKFTFASFVYRSVATNCNRISGGADHRLEYAVNRGELTDEFAVRDWSSADHRVSVRFPDLTQRRSVERPPSGGRRPDRGVAPRRAFYNRHRSRASYDYAEL